MDQEKRPIASETSVGEAPLGGRPKRAAWVKKNNTKALKKLAPARDANKE